MYIYMDIIIALVYSVIMQRCSAIVDHCARYYNVTHCNGLTLYGRLVRLLRNNSVWSSAVHAGVIRSRSRLDSRQRDFFSLFFSSLIIHEVYI